MDCVPFESTAIDAYQSKDAWDATAAELVATMLARWNLGSAHAIAGGESGSVLHVRQSDGTPAVLKVGYPHFEGVWEAVGLEALGPFAPTVLRQDAWTWSLLLEAILPGDRLSDATMPAPDALDIAGRLLAQVGETAMPGDVLRLEAVIDAYVGQARDRLPGQENALRSLRVHDLVTRAIDDCEQLTRSVTTERFLHGDFNPGNIITDGERWFVIDPKPMIGDPAFDLEPAITQIGDVWGAPNPELVIDERIRHLAGLADIDPQRAKAWAFARSALDVTWHLADGSREWADRSAGQLRVWARLL